MLELDEWGYPMIADADLPEHLRGDAERAISACPRLALRLEQSSSANSRAWVEQWQ